MGQLEEYIPVDDVRQMLKTYNRQYGQYMKLKVKLKNNLISLLDETFPGVNSLFTSAPRKTDGHEKWVDFVAKFWHCECVCGLSENVFKERYQKWCKKAEYNFSKDKAKAIYAKSSDYVNTLPKTDATRLLLAHAVDQLNTITETLATIQKEMLALSSSFLNILR